MKKIKVRIGNSKEGFKEYFFDTIDEATEAVKQLTARLTISTTISKPNDEEHKKKCKEEMDSIKIEFLKV